MDIALNLLPVNKKGRVAKIEACGKEKRRMLDLGIVEGTEIEAVQKSPMGDPVAYLFRGTVIALREEDASKVTVTVTDSINQAYIWL